jgi:hypothetical protein
MKLERPGLLLINGEQGRGKSKLIDYLMYKNRKNFDYGVVFTNTHFEPGNYDYISEKYIHPEYDESVLESLMKIQEDLIKEKKFKDCFVIFDDCIDKKQFESPVLKRACTQLRHYNMTIIFATQYANILPPWMRSNAMGIVMFLSDSHRNLKALFESYGQKFDSFNNFKNYIMMNLGNYKFVYYDKKHITDDIFTTYRVMICPAKIPKFKIKFNKIVI